MDINDAEKKSILGRTATLTEANFYKSEIELVAKETDYAICNVIAYAFQSNRQSVAAFLKNSMYSATTSKGAHKDFTCMLCPHWLKINSSQTYQHRYNQLETRVFSQHKTFENTHDYENIYYRCADQAEIESFVTTVIKERLAEIADDELGSWLSDFISSNTDLATPFKFLEFVINSNQDLKKAFSARVLHGDSMKYNQVRKSSTDLRNNRNKFIGHVSDSIMISMTPASFIEILQEHSALLRLVEVDQYKEDFEKVYAHCDRDIAKAKLAPLKIEEIRKHINNYSEGSFFHSEVIPTYDVKKGILYFYSMEDVQNVIDQVQSGFHTGSEQYALKLNEKIVKLTTLMKDTAENMLASVSDISEETEPKENVVSLPQSEAVLQTVPEHTVEKTVPEAEVEQIVPEVEYFRSAIPGIQGYSAGHLKKEELQDLFQNSIVFTDFTFWMSEIGQTSLAYQAVPLLHAMKQSVWVDWATRVKLNTIENDTTGSFTEKEKETAHHAHNEMHSLHGRGISYLPATNDYPTSSDTLLAIIEKNPDKNICILSCDDFLLNIIAQNDYHNVFVINPFPGNSFIVMKQFREIFHRNAMGETGSADEKEDQETATVEKKSEDAADFSKAENQEKEADHKPERMDIRSHERKKQPRLFAETFQCIPENNDFIPVEQIPSSNEELAAGDGRKVILGSVIAFGGEGTVYETNQKDIVAKIYNKEHLTVNRREKIKLMVDHAPMEKRICWPVASLVNHDGQFVGYLMPRVDAKYKEFGYSVLSLNKETIRNGLMKSWNRLSLASLCYELCITVENLHHAGILLGDINPRNFMINPEDPTGKDFMIVDADSCQIGGYPCPVGTVIYTSPKIYERLHTDQPQFGTFLRTEGDEDYAFSSLLFSVLMLNQSPFAGKGTTDIVEALRNYQFAYRRKNDNGDIVNTGKDVPDGPYKMIWNNTFLQIRELFAHEFADGEDVSTSAWKKVLYKYIRLINDGIYTSELMPVKYFVLKDDDSFIDYECDGCHQERNMNRNTYEIQKKYNQPHLCNSCKALLNEQEDQEVKCTRCGKTNVIPALQYWTLQFQKKRYICPDCIKRQNSFGKTQRSKTVFVKCAKCGKTFGASAEYVDRRTANHKPLFCSDCRQMLYKNNF